MLDDDTERPAWQADYFVGMPAPAGAVVVMLPVYLGFIGLPLTVLTAFVGAFFTIVVALLMVSRLPVHSGKTFGARIPGDRVMPLLLGVVFYVLLLATYTWQTMSVSALAYLAFLPVSAAAYARRARLAEAEPAAPADRRQPRGVTRAHAAASSPSFSRAMRRAAA